GVADAVVDHSLQLGVEPEAAVPLVEVDPRQPQVVLGAEELAGARRGRRVRLEQLVDEVVDALLVGGAGCLDHGHGPNVLSGPRRTDVVRSCRRVGALAWHTRGVPSTTAPPRHLSASFAAVVLASVAIAGCTSFGSSSEEDDGVAPAEQPSATVTVPPIRLTPFCQAMIDLADRLENDPPDDI